MPTVERILGGKEDFRKFVGNKLLCEITSGDLNRYVSKRLSEGAGAWSINKEVQVWSLILKKARLWHRLRDDYEPLPTKVSDIGRVVSREELQNLAKIAQENEMWEAVFYGFVLAANTGLRGGEIKKNYGLGRLILSAVVWLCAVPVQRPMLALGTLS